MTPEFGCVILTTGKRPVELRRAIESVLRQENVRVDCVVVGNGWKPVDLPDGVRGLPLTENAGIPAGRNAGVKEVSGSLLVFVDDDACLAQDDLLARAAAMFDREPALGVVQPRVIDPDGRETPRRFVPRLRVGDTTRSSDVAALWEGVCLMRRAALSAAGPWPDGFFYAHEGIDLAWRMIDAGYRVRYSGELAVYHPAVNPTRHSFYYYMSARNRVWLARRNLPVPLAFVYVLTWFVLTVVRLRRWPDTREVLRGYRDGMRLDCGTRRPIGWRTVWRMTRSGRPPVI